MGRINFGRAIKDFKGIVGDVTLTTQIGDRPFSCNLKDWKVFALPDEMAFYETFKFKPATTTTDSIGKRAPGLYRGTFNVKKPADTFLDFSMWGKGLVFVNGHPLGRIWEIGTQQTLYTPGCWLKKGENEILVFDILGPRELTVKGLKSPVIDKLQGFDVKIADRESQRPDIENVKPVLTGEFAPGNGWQTVILPEPSAGRCLTIEAIDSHSGDDLASIAELYVLDSDGKRLSREHWVARYADSEDMASNRTAAKAFDLQESTAWATAPDSPYPHTITIDLGATCTVSALEMLPRMESFVPGAIKRFRLYLAE